MSQHLGGNASDMLNFNMESISNELSALLIDSDSFGYESTAGGGARNMEPGLHDVGLHYYSNQYNQRQQHMQPRLLQPMHYNSATVFGAMHGRGANASAFANNVSHGMQPIQDVSPVAYTPSSFTVPTSASPKFEFHFLRSQSYNKTSQTNDTVPLISAAGEAGSQGGAQEHIFGGGSGARHYGAGYRKFQKAYQKQPEPSLEEEIDYDKVVVDLSVLGLSLDNKERNAVLRLFALFRLMHFYLNEEFPSGEPLSANAVETYTCVAAKSAMPCTMNVQYQVKQAARQCTIFLCDMQRIINANKLYDREMYMECERSLNTLRKLLTQFEVFKRIELEHKRGQFVKEEGRVQAECLERLMQQLNEQIREAHFYVHLFNWAMEKRYKSPQMPQELSPMQKQQLEAEQEEIAGAAAALPVFCEELQTVQNDERENEAVAGVAQANECLNGIFTSADVERQSVRYIGYK